MALRGEPGRAWGLSPAPCPLSLLTAPSLLPAGCGGSRGERRLLLALGQVLGPLKVDTQVPVEVLFTNPLAQEVRDCVLLAEGSDLLEEKLRLE